MLVCPVPPALVGPPSRRVGRVGVVLSLFPRMLEYLIGFGVPIVQWGVQLTLASVVLHRPLEDVDG
ncbi:MAG: hypothetical protein WHS83_00825 [Chloroflexus sp.]|uniref:hypothetical protein n=1 Tax=Chloroflexus sp. TaxID=1904827 RepID=UPI0030B64B87